MESTLLIAMLIIVMMGLRIPSALGKFNTYIGSAVGFLDLEDPVTHIKNGVRLGLLTTEVAQLVTLLGTWTAAYALHSNPATKTKITRVTVVNFMKNFRTLFNPMLKRIDASPACTDEDRKELNIAPKGTYTKKTTSIKDQVYDIAIQLGGGQIEMVCRTSSDSKSASIHPDATGWYIAYDIVDIKFEQNPELSSKVKKYPPKSPEDCYNYGFYSRAREVLDVGAEHKGREMVYFVRWYDHKNPKLAGPYGPAKTIVIL
jgi:hypothetical protein